MMYKSAPAGFLDWLVILIAFSIALAPPMYQCGLISETWLWPVKIFPSGYFVVALFYVVLKNLIPAIRLDFQLPLTRMVVILGLIAVLGMYYMGISVGFCRFGYTQNIKIWEFLVFPFLSVPKIFMIGAGIVVFFYMVTGKKLGPVHDA